MPKLFNIIDIRFTQSQGWVIDGYLTPQSILPVSAPFDYHLLYAEGACFSEYRAKIKSMFEQAINK